MGKILIVDDDTSSIKLLQAEFQHDHSIVVAKSGKMALELIRKSVPDIILLDIIMPGMNGFDVIDILKKDPNNKHIPIICITGLDSEDNEEFGLTLGAADYVYKPFYMPVVRARVETQLRIVGLQKELNMLRRQYTGSGSTEKAN